MTSSFSDRFVALKCLSVLDHTYLPDDCKNEEVEIFVNQALSCSPFPYCFCVFPDFIPVVNETIGKKLGDSTGHKKIPIAAVVNFPHGQKEIDVVVEETKNAISKGADEIDVVLNHKLLKEDKEKGKEHNAKLIRAVKDAMGDLPLKVILETGELMEDSLIRLACEITIENGGNFLKTATGKTPVSATPEAVAVLIDVVKEHRKKDAKNANPIGIKISGGVKNLDDAARYMYMTADTLGIETLKPQSFRFGASSLWSTLQAVLDTTSSEEKDRKIRRTDDY